MKKKSIILIVSIVLLINGYMSWGVEGQGVLKLVQVITRHGARAPYNLFNEDRDQGVQWNCTAHPAGTLEDNGKGILTPSTRLYAPQYVPNNQVLKGNCGQGELTLQGCQMHTTLGQQLRNDYGSFLPSNYTSGAVYIRSTDVARTIESASCFMSGLYPNNNNNGNQEIKTIWTNEASVDTMQLPSHCPLAVQLCNAVQITPDWIDHLTAMAPLKQKLEKQWGIGDSQFPVWTSIQSTLQCRDAAGVSSPSYLTQQDHDAIMSLANWQMAALWNNTRTAQVLTGPFLQELQNNILAVVNGLNGPSDPVFRLYSGHDTTVGPLLAGLQAFPSEWPPFAANIRLELWLNGADWFVRGLYNGNLINFGYQPPCAEYCPLQQFLKIVQPSIPLDVSQLCNSVPSAAPTNDYTSFLCSSG